MREWRIGLLDGMLSERRWRLGLLLDGIPWMHHHCWRRMHYHCPGVATEVIA